MVVEQLRYTWSREGLSGHNLYQPVGVSTGLRDMASKTYRLALRLCRYDYPIGRSDRPRSFGWVDSGGKRFAFSRVFLPDDQLGHPGNFAAHVLVGTPRELPVSLLLKRRHSPMWWTAPQLDENPDLPPVDLTNHASVSPNRSNSPARELLARILSGASYLELHADSEQLLQAAQAISEVLPQVLEARSFSSFEHAETRMWFQVVGVNSGSDPEVISSSPAMLAASFALSGTVSPRQLGMLLGTDAKSVGAMRRFTAVAASLESLRRSDAVAVEDILVGLRDTGAVADVLDYSRAQEVTAVALRNGDAKAIDALQRNRSHIPDSTWRQLGAKVADLCRPPTTTHPPATLLAKFPRAFSVGIAERLLGLIETADSQEAINDWPSLLVRAALSIDQIPEERLRHAAAQKGDSDWLAEPEVPILRRLNLMDDLLAAGKRIPLSTLTSAPDLLDVALRSRVEVLHAAAAQLARPEAARLLTAALRALIGANRPSLAGQLGALIRSVAQNAPLGDALQLVQTASTALAQKEPGWDRFAQSIAWSYVKAAVADPRFPLSTVRSLVEIARQPTLLSQLLAEARANSPEATKAGRLWETHAASDRLALMQFFAEAALASAHKPTAVIDQLWKALGPAPIDAIRVLLIAANRSVCCEGSAPAVAWPVFLYLGDSVTYGRLDPKVLDQQGNLLQLLSDTFRRLQRQDASAAEQYLQFVGVSRPGKAWVKLLTGYSRIR